METKRYNELHKYNIDLMKFIAAILVIISHAYVLNDAGEDPLLRLTDGTFGFGKLAVAYFFFVSGYYISQSAKNSGNAFEFFRKRVQRLIPPLFIVVLLCILLLYFFSSLDFYNYFLNKSTWAYLSNAVMILRHSLPGVFENNIYGNTVNGSLWTLPIEFLCYVACYLCGRCRILSKKGTGFLVLLYIVLYITWKFLSSHFSIEIGILESAFQPVYMFLIGMFLSEFDNDKLWNWKFGILVFLLMIPAFTFHIYYLAVWVCLPYVFYIISFMPVQCSRHFKIAGEISYPIYLCAFPIQQSLISLNGRKMAVLPNAIITIVMSCIYGFCYIKISSHIRKRIYGS